MRQAAEELDDPAWCAYVAWQRAQLVSGANRARQYELAVSVADTASRPEIQGMANLTAALAAAVQDKADLAQTHLTEATAFADQLDVDVSPWAQMSFGRTNVGIWRVAIGVELGYGAKVAEIAETVNPTGVSRSRQAMFWIDYGRGLLADSKTRQRGLVALLRAEKLAPLKVRTNVFVREAVTHLLAGARRDAGGRELRGLAYRMGIAPTG